MRFSIRDWALRAGLVRLSESMVLAFEDADTLKRFLQDAGTRRYISKQIDERSIKLKGKITRKRLQSLLRELGYLVELGDPVA